MSKEFLLTRLMRGAALTALPLVTVTVNFYSRASCEARLVLSELADHSANFYSRASCEARPYMGEKG